MKYFIKYSSEDVCKRNFKIILVFDKTINTNYSSYNNNFSTFALKNNLSKCGMEDSKLNMCCRGYLGDNLC